MEEKSSSRGFYIGLLAGGAIGGLAVLLTAPKSGKELRKDLRKRTRKIAGNTEEYIDSTRKRATEIISDGKDKAEELVNDAKSMTSSIINRGKDYFSEEVSKMKDAFKAGSDTFSEESKSKKTR